MGVLTKGARRDPASAHDVKRDVAISRSTVWPGRGDLWARSTARKNTLCPREVSSPFQAYDVRPCNRPSSAADQGWPQEVPRSCRTVRPGCL